MKIVGNRTSFKIGILLSFCVTVLNANKVDAASRPLLENKNMGAQKKTFWQRMGFGTKATESKLALNQQQPQQKAVKSNKLNIGMGTVRVEKKYQPSIFSKIAKVFKKPERVVGTASIQLLRNDLFKLKGTNKYSHLNERIKTLQNAIKQDPRAGSQPGFVKEHDRIKKEITDAPRRNLSVEKINQKAKETYRQVMSITTSPQLRDHFSAELKDALTLQDQNKRLEVLERIDKNSNFINNRDSNPVMQSKRFQELPPLVDRRSSALEVTEM